MMWEVGGEIRWLPTSIETPDIIVSSKGSPFSRELKKYLC